MSLNPLLFHSLKVIPSQADRPHQWSPLRCLGPHLCSSYHSMRAAARRLDNLVPSPPTITLPIPPAYLWCQRRMSLQVCTFQFQHLGEEPSAQLSGIWTAEQGSWLPSHLSSRPGPSPHSGCQNCEQSQTGPPWKAQILGLWGNLY